MRNPYEVLGVNQNASDDEIKSAYKNLVKKYHPDKYVNNPLSGLAEEKIKEINEAYSIIKKERETVGGSTRQTSGQSNYGGSYTNSQRSYSNQIYNQIKTYINTRRFNEAYNLLSSIKESDRDAEWYYLAAIVTSSIGWSDMAYQYINRAVSMDPYNMDYKNLLNQMTFSNRSYREFSQARGYTGSSIGPCELCTCLCCGDSCCECMGGDLIGCC